MAELETQADSSAPTPPANPPADPSVDPIARLHRMSTTAGVGTQEYVAINNLAVVAAVLGVATALSFVGAPFMLLGLAGLICGVIAFRQIRSSNGTQGGRGLAILGILLSLLLVGGALANIARENSQQRQEEQRIAALIGQLRTHIVAKDYDSAYTLFAPEFRQAVPLAAFKQRWQVYDNHFQGVQDLQPNNVYRFATSGEGQIVDTQVLIKVGRYADPERDRRSIKLRKTGSSDWAILQFEIFDL